MTSYKVISIPGDKIIAKNLTYSQANNLRHSYSLENIGSTILIEKEDKMNALEIRDLKTKLALEALANFHVYASDMRYGKGRLDQHVDKIAAYAGLHWDKRFQVWYTNKEDAQHELFKLHWQISIATDLQYNQTGALGHYSDIAIRSIEWLNDRGFNPQAIFEHWQKSLDEDNLEHCTICGLSAIDGLNENNLCPLCTADLEYKEQVPEGGWKNWLKGSAPDNEEENTSLLRFDEYFDEWSDE